MELTYSIILTREDGVVYATCPTLNLHNGEIDYYSTYGETPNETLCSIKEFIVLNLIELEESGVKFPVEKYTGYELQKNQTLSYINFDYSYEKSKVKQVFKNKTVTLPTWLESLARNKNLNFSQILQKALKKELNITD